MAGWSPSEAALGCTALPARHQNPISESHSANSPHVGWLQKGCQRRDSLRDFLFLLLLLGNGLKMLVLFVLRSHNALLAVGLGSGPLCIIISTLRLPVMVGGLPDTGTLR